MKGSLSAESVVSLNGLAHLRGVAAVLGLVAGEHAVGAVDLGLALGGGPLVLELALLRGRVLGVGVEGLVGGLVDGAAEGLAHAVDALEARLDVLSDARHDECLVFGDFGF
jgi:hypothetical protein